MDLKKVRTEGMHRPSSAQDAPGPGSKDAAHRAEGATHERPQFSGLGGQCPAELVLPSLCMGLIQMPKLPAKCDKKIKLDQR